VRCVIAVAAALVVGLHLFVVPRPGWHLDTYRIDLDVYRLGGQVWLRGGPLYDAFPATLSGRPLPFTYPPVAAVLFSPLGAAPLAVDSVLVTLVSIALVGAVVAMVLRAQGHAPSPWWVAAAATVALLLEPVRETLSFGQVNLLLLAAVLADGLLERAPWPRGLLVGLVAAVKLTPLVVLLQFLLRGDRRAVVTGLLGFVGGTVVGALLAPRDSLQYWTATVFAAGRIGDPVAAVDQNLRAVVARLGLAGPVATGVWALGAALVIGLAAVAARRALQADRPALALVLVGIAGLLASPVSWSHHWVWCLPALLVLSDLGRTHRVPRLLAVSGLALFLTGAHGLLPHSDGAERGWTLWQQVVGAGYVLWALLLLGAAAAGGHRWSSQVHGGADASQRREGRPGPATTAGSP
jgi:alpha-1,2-mannosyltransferase